MRWFQGSPPQVHRQILNATDEEVESFVRSLMLNDFLVADARQAGVDVPEEDFVVYRDRYARRLSQLRDRLGIDSALAKARNERERVRLLEEGVDRYVEFIARTQKDIVVVPPGLASILRREHKWKVSLAGVDRAAARAEAIRAALEPAAEETADIEIADPVKP
jgi:predicted PilT family ATPase